MVSNGIKITVGTVLGSGIIGPIVGANWQEWAKANGSDQFLVRHLGPAMDEMARITLSNPFLFTAVLLAGIGMAIAANWIIRRWTFYWTKRTWKLVKSRAVRKLAAMTLALFFGIGLILTLLWLAIESRHDVQASLIAPPKEIQKNVAATPALVQNTVAKEAKTSFPKKDEDRIVRALFLQKGIKLAKVNRADLADIGNKRLEFIKHPATNIGTGRSAGVLRQRWEFSITPLQDTLNRAFPDKNFDLKTIPSLGDRSVKPVPGDEDITDDEIKMNYRKFYTYLNETVLSPVDKAVAEMEKQLLSLKRSLTDAPSALPLMELLEDDK